VILSHVWEALKIETSQGPDIKLFMRFRDIYNRLSESKTSDFSYLDFGNDTTALAQEISTMLSSKDCYRGDYKELITLALIFLAKEEVDSFRLQCPGAIHRARWMSKLLYSMKIVLLSDKILAELPEGAVFRVGQLAKLQRFVRFVVVVYIPWWISCSQACDAPVNDLKLLKIIHG
jgi:hypothetical protein